VIVQKAHERKNRIRPIASLYRIQPCSIHQWKKNLAKLRDKALVNPNAKTTHKGKLVDDLNLEKDLKKWITEQRAKDIMVRTRDIIN